VDTPLAVGEMSVGFAAMGLLLALIFWKGFNKEALLAGRVPTPEK